MGSSSKKHKDKERESRKRHHRNRSKSRERERPPGDGRSREKRRDSDEKRHLDKNKDKKRLKESAPDDHRAGDRSRHRDDARNFDDIKPKSSGGDISLSVDETNKVRARLGLKPLEDKNSVPEVKSKSSGGEISLSVEETNKVRARLGLKPLEDNSSAAASGTGEEGDKQEFVHKPAENLSNKRFVERLREKVALQKEKRIINKKLSNVRGLADSDSDDDVSNWVKKNRVLSAEKLKAQQRAKLLEEMDEEFGVGSLVEDEFNTVKAKAYSARDLKGLKVEHSQRSFAEGQTVVLTLKDKGVLDEEEDALVNQNMIDKEKANKNVIRKKAKPGYVPFEEEESDDDDDEADYLQGLKNAQSKNLLNKYDEEIDGERKKSFVLGAKGVARSASERELIRQKLRQKQGAVSLDSTMKLASEYYTEEDMVKFKKPVKKVRKEKRSKKLRADDLLALQEVIGGGHGTSDLGSRRGSRKSPRADDKPHKSILKKPRMEIPEIKPDPDIMEIDPPDYLDEPEILGPEEDLSGYQVETDEAEIELQLVLAKSRLMKDRNASSSRDDKVLEHVRSFHGHQDDRMAEDSDDDDGDGGQGRAANDATNKSSIVLNSTAEFCRALGDIPTYGMSGNRDEDVEDLMTFEREQLEEKVPMQVDDGSMRGAWNEVEAIEEEEGSPAKIKKEDVTILDEEPVVGSGMAGALQLAMKKGYLDNETKKVMGAPRHSVLQATSYTIEDKAIMEDDRLNRRERFSAGPVSDFKDKDGYRPDVKLEYIDDSGRLLNPKEAFRYLSHKFHGKGSGKNKTEKRMKKLQEENLMKQMSSTDTPLGTLNLLQEKQRQTQSPYILLSGGSKALNASSISKAK